MTQTESRPSRGYRAPHRGDRLRPGLGRWRPMTGSGVLWGLLGLTGVGLAALAGLILLAPQGPRATPEALPVPSAGAPDGLPLLPRASVDSERGPQSRTQAPAATLNGSASAVGNPQGPMAPASMVQRAVATPTASPSTPNPSLAFENAPGVLGVSLRTRRKEALKAYPTESLGALALGLEDLRLSPSQREGRLEVNLGDLIRYDQREHEVPKSSHRLLDGIGRLLAENPDTQVEILSHTDDEGESGFNLRLSQRRADAIKEYLVGRGVDRDRIRAQGRGEGAPLIDTGRRTPTRAERAMNRRTELVIEPRETAIPTPVSDEAPRAHHPLTVKAAREPTAGD